MTETFTRWDSADYLDTDEDMRLYLDACLEDDPGDGSLIRRALDTIARARNQSDLARRVGITREGLRKALSPHGNPSFALVLRIARELGLDLRLTVHHTVTTGR